MKAFYRKAIALCLFLAILFLTVGSSAAGDVVGLRGLNIALIIASI